MCCYVAILEIEYLFKGYYDCIVCTHWNSRDFHIGTVLLKFKLRHTWHLKAGNISHTSSQNSGAYLCLFRYEFHCHVKDDDIVIKVWHYSDVVMRAMSSHITSISIICLACCSGTDQRKHLVASGFPIKMASNVENLSIWWRHHGE